LRLLRVVQCSSFCTAEPHEGLGALRLALRIASKRFLGFPWSSDRPARERDAAGPMGRRRERQRRVYATAQLVYTLTEFASIDRVTLVVNGRRCCVYDHGSKPVAPVSRDTFSGWQGVPSAE